MIYVVGERLGTGRSRERLAELIGVTVEEMMAHAVWVNLWDYPGAVPDNYATMIEQAARSEDSVILLGRRVADVFSLVRKPPLSEIVRNAGVGPLILLLPHPSGLNRWYNDPANETAARDALHAVWLRSGR
jgi:hypothetical protein